MSAVPEPDFDLEKLFLPAWAQDSPKVNRYANFAGDDRPDRKSDGRHERRPPRRDRPGGPSGPRPGGLRPDAGRRRDQRPEYRPSERMEPRPAPLPPVPLNVLVLPEEKGVESLARQIRVTGRAYPLFDIAHLILQKPERHQIRFEVRKGAEGPVLQPLFLCALDDTLWTSEDEAVQHVLARHFATFYQMEKTPTDPPRGTYTFVAQCGLSGKILGPPNYHDYQAQLHKLHTERFSRMPFDAFKARVKIVKDEAVVKQWLEERSFKTEYNCLNVPEPKKLGSRDEVTQHFREVHMPNIIKNVETHTLSGVAAKQLRSPTLQRAVRSASEDQRRFPLQVATSLSQQFAGHGLQFFKVNRTVTHVSVARPRYLDMEATPVSEGVKKVVDYINAHPKCTRKKLFEALAPVPKSTAPPAAPPTAGATETPPVQPEATPEQTALAGDLHWLIHEGHVIEFANGVLETAKKPLPRPPKPEKAAVTSGDAAAQSGAVAPPAESPEAGAPGSATPAEVTSTEPLNISPPSPSTQTGAVAPSPSATDQPAA